MDVTLDQVNKANHGRVGYTWKLQRKLKEEDSWMMRLGTFYHQGGFQLKEQN